MSVTDDQTAAKRSRVRILWALTAGERGRLGAALACMTLATLAGYVPPLIGRVTIDHVIAGGELGAPGWARAVLAWLGAASAPARTLFLAGVAIVALTALSGVLQFLQSRWVAVAAEAVARALRMRLYDHIQRLPCRYLDQHDTGDLIQRASSDVDTVRQFYAVQAIEIGRSAVMVGVALPIMMRLHMTLGLLAMLLVPPIIIYATIFFALIRQSFQRMDEAEGAMTAVLQENITGIRVVRAFARQAYEADKFGARNAAYCTGWRHLMRLFAWYWSISDLICLTQLGIVLLVGTRYVARGELSVGTFYAFWMYVNMFLWPIRHLGQVLAELGKASVSVGRLREILDAPTEDAASAAATPSGDRQQDAPAGTAPARDAATIGGEIVFEHVTFAHAPEVDVLDDVSFRVAVGQTLAVVGPSGSGKSTLINLLLRFYDARTGRVLIDGIPLTDWDRRALRARIGVVMQEPFLYARTIRDNIVISHAEAGDEEIAEAASVACIHETISTFHQQYDTVIGERGITLSGGQRQRVAIARAILSNPPILILDDALSAVDTRTERMILDALQRRRGRRTTIVIAHRLSTLMAADSIIVLERGRITQAGTHAELVDTAGLYRRLWEAQTVDAA